MTDPFEKLTRAYPHYIHRVKLIPTTLLRDQQTNTDTPVQDGSRLEEGLYASAMLDQRSEDVITQPLLIPEKHGDQQGPASRPVASRTGAYVFKVQARDTLPTLPLLVPASRALRPVPVTPVLAPPEREPSLPAPAVQTTHPASMEQRTHPASAGQATHSEISGAAGNAAVVGLGNISGFFFKYANNIVVQRTLGVGSFGLYSASLSLVTLISSIFDLGMDNAMIRYIAIYRGRKQQTNSIRNLVLFCTSLVGITGLIGAFLVLVLAPSLAKLIHKPEATPILQILAPIIPLLCLQTVWTGGLQGLKEFKRRVFIQRFVVPLMLLLLMTGALLFWRNITGVAVLALLSTIISTTINLYFLFRAVSRISDLREEKYEVRTWLGFALPNFLTTIVNTMLDSIDTLLLAFFVSNAQIGQYAAAIKISLFISLPLTSLNIVFMPTIADLYTKKEHSRLASMFKIVTKWTITLSLPIFLITTLFSVPLLALSGKSFIGAWPLLIALSTGYMISAATGSVGFMLLMTGHQKYSLFNSAATIILNIVLGLILTPRYGAMGTAISTGIAISVINIIRLVEVYFLLKMFPYRWDTLKPLLAGLISGVFTGGLIYLLNLTHFKLSFFHWQLSIQLALVPVFIASYMFLLVMFKINPEDEIVLNKLRKKFGAGKKAKPQRKVV